MTDLTDRIAAHPVAAAMEEYQEAIADGCRWSVCSSDRERMAAAEAALTAALDVEDAQEERISLLAHTVEDLLAQRLDQHGEIQRLRFLLRETLSSIGGHCGVDHAGPHCLAGLTARVGRELERPVPLQGSVASLEGQAVTHERQDEPAGLTGCCGRTEPRITSEGGVFVDDPGAVTCPGEEE